MYTLVLLFLETLSYLSISYLLLIESFLTSWNMSFLFTAEFEREMERIGGDIYMRRKISNLEPHLKNLHSCWTLKVASFGSPAPLVTFVPTASSQTLTLITSQPSFLETLLPPGCLVAQIPNAATFTTSTFNLTAPIANPNPRTVSKLALLTSSNTTQVPQPVS
ncbi:hypothetical protein VNO77_20806 [Canavalia gladiata]|uniref:Uncharacterized protein n=1 Tax=Canavalia gladiata TaxID=3824 RepID=A0AAN9QLR2_CANGL